MVDKAQDKASLSKLNSFLLTLCTSGIIWGAAKLTNIDTRLSSLEAKFGIRVDEMSEIKGVQNTHTSILGDVIVRLSKLEYIELQNQKK